MYSVRINSSLEILFNTEMNSWAAVVWFVLLLPASPGHNIKGLAGKDATVRNYTVPQHRKEFFLISCTHTLVNYLHPFLQGMSNEQTEEKKHACVSVLQGHITRPSGNVCWRPAKASCLHPNRKTLGFFVGTISCLRTLPWCIWTLQRKAQRCECSNYDTIQKQFSLFHCVLVK